jgi:hypothetical protein
LEPRASSPAAQSSKPSASRLSSVHILVSSFAALAGVALAAYQAFGPSGAPPAPVTVTVAIDPQKVTTEAAAAAPVEQPVAVKANAEAPVALGMGASYAAALKDGSDQRYDFARLFDGKPETYLTLMAPDSEINVMVTFNDGTGRPVSEIEYQPPEGVDPAKLATVADVMVLPDGQLEASGRPVTSFALPTDAGRKSFALPTPEPGKGVWLRIAGAPGATGTVVGDFRIRRSE